MKSVILSVLMILFLAPIGLTEVPKVVNYQGVLMDSAGDPVIDGIYSVVFTIYDASSGGNTKWSETQNVTTIDGIFSILLGSVTAIEDSVFNMSNRYLGIQVDTDPELTPRTQLGSVPYAMHAGTVTTGSTASDWTVGGDLQDLYNGGGILTLFPPTDYAYGFKWIDDMIHEALCTKWNVGLRFYNIVPYFVNSDNPTTGMDYGGVMFYIETNASDDDAATPSAWKHSYWKIDSSNSIVVIGSNGLQNTDVYVRKR